MRKLRNFVLLIVGSFCALSVVRVFPVQCQTGKTFPTSIVLDGSAYLRSTWPSSPSVSFTFEVWVYPTSSGHLSYLLYQGDSTYSGFGLALETNGLPAAYGTITVGGQEEPVTGNSARLPLRQWTHLAFVRDSSLWYLYKNGVKIGRGHYQPDSIPLPLNVGRGFVGSLAEIMIWSRALSDSEIRSQLYTPIPDTLSGLVGHWPSQNEIIGSHTTLANSATGLPALQSIAQSGSAVVQVAAGGPPEFSVPYPNVKYFEFPRHQQLFPRNAQGFGTVSVRGALGTPGFDSVLLEVWRNDTLLRTRSIAASYTSGLAPFDFSEPIRVELAEYTVRLLVKQGTVAIPVTEGADLVAGDAFFINGQSNAHPAVFGYTWQNPYARTFGVQTPNWNLTAYDPADTFWGLANGSGWGEWFAGPYLTGAWGFGMQERIAANWQVPTCVLNGAAGNTAIADHYRNDSSTYDLSTVYGRALYRLTRASIKDHLRAIFWYQGEFDSGRSYYPKFVRLLNQWKEDFHYEDSAVAPQRTYVFQVRPGCQGGDGALREVQRELPDSIRGLETFSTSAVSGHTICHFWWFGYQTIADQVFAVLDRDYYGSSDTAFLDAPNVRQVEYADSLHESIRVTLREPDPGIALTEDSVYVGTMRRIVESFFLDHATGMIESVRVDRGGLLLTLNGPSSAKYLTYQPDRTYPDDTVIFEGPWVVNKRGIGLLSFDSIPIGPYVPDTESAGTAPGGGDNFQCQLRFLLGRPALLIHSVHALSASLLIVDEIGRTISSIPLAIGVGDSDIPLDADPLPAGPLFVRVVAAGQTSTFRFVNP